MKKLRIAVIGCGAGPGGGESYWGVCHERQLAAAYRALRAGEPLPWTPEDAKKTLEIVQAIYLSARTQSPVRL